MVVDFVEVVAVSAIGAAILLHGEEDDEFRHRRRERTQRPVLVRVCVDDYRHLEVATFKEHFRMDRTVFEKLLVFVGNHLTTRGRLIRQRTSLDICLMMSIWVLATQDTFRSVALKFNVKGKGTVHFHFKVIIEALREMSPLYICWPNEYERDGISAHFERKCNYPGCVGCLDGTHVYISAPLVQPERSINRFRKYSTIVQAVCDHRLLFRDVYIGEPGSVHDARVLQRSPLGYKLLHDENLLSPNEHVLGDGAYTLTNKVITPYRDDGNLSRRRRRHNFTHASTRCAIERAFGIWKGKWRRLKLMLIFSKKYLNDLLISTLVLHNFIILQGEAYTTDNNWQPLEPAAPNAPVANAGIEVPEVDPALLPAKAAGCLRRNYIASLIYPQDE